LVRRPTGLSENIADRGGDSAATSESYLGGFAGVNLGTIQSLTARAQAPDKAKPAPSAQAPEKPIDSKSQTTGQGGTAQPSQSPNQGAAPSAAARETKSGAPAALSTEQHVKFRETIRGEKVERLTNVAFLITVGEAVPRTVHRYRFPVSVMEYAPQYRGYEYILVGDEILVVDPRTMRIVAVIPA
jgi:hypothetical protein